MKQNVLEVRGNEEWQTLKAMWQEEYTGWTEFIGVNTRNAAARGHTKALAPTHGPSPVSTPAGKTLWNFMGLQEGTAQAVTVLRNRPQVIEIGVDKCRRKNGPKFLVLVQVITP